MSKLIKPRPYQVEILDKARLSLRKHRCVLIHLPTGGGKTVIAATIATGIKQRARRAWFICHRDFLLEQTSLTFDKVGIDHSFVAAGQPMNVDNPTMICSVGTLARRLEKLEPPDFLLWDECKHIAAASWKKIFEWAPKAKHIGFDATPCRLDGKGLDLFFEDMVSGPDTAWLIENGYLSPYKYYAPSKPDMGGVHTVAGDFNRKETDAIMDDNEIIGDMVRHYRQKADGLRAIYFAVSVEHSRHIAATFNASGIPALHLDGTSSTDERSAGAIAMAQGRVKVISNVDLFGEGYDLSAQAGMDVTIECVGLARPTKSLALHLQQVGRALRPKDRHAVILDHAGNFIRHGLPDEERQWTLQGVTKIKTSSGGMPVRQCPTCFAVHPPAPTCSYCGHVYEVEGRYVEEVEGDLKEVDAEEIKRSKKAEVSACKTLEDLINLGIKRGYKKPETWAAHIWTYKNKRGTKRAEEQYKAYAR